MVEATLGVGAALAAGALLTLKKKKRSILDPAREAEKNLLLSTVSQLDTGGCVQKLLCLLETKESASRIHEEAVLDYVFNSQIDTITPYNAPYVYAAQVGAISHNATKCEEYFPKCPLSEVSLTGYLRQAWRCGV